MNARAPSQAALSRAAKVAAAEGVCIEWKDGVWRISPAAAQPADEDPFAAWKAKREARREGHR